MIIYDDYEKFIRGHKDLVELNIIKLIENTFKLSKKEVIYSDNEKRPYIYKDKYWQQITLEEIVSEYWTVFTSDIFYLLVDNRDKIKFLIGESTPADKKKYGRILKRYDFFISFKLRKVKEYIDSWLGSCTRLYDKEDTTIPLQNGYINLDDFSFNKIDSQTHNRYVLKFNYISTKKEPKIFLKFLKQILPNEENREFMLDWLAYILVRGNYRQKALFLYGSGRNGKGVLSRIMYDLVGATNCSTLTVSQLTFSNQNKSFISKLHNKLLNLSPDSQRTDKIAIDTFKVLTGGDTYTTRDVYEKAFDTRYHGKLIFSINEVPYFSDKNDAVMQRLEILEFPVTIPTEERIPDLERIILEKEGDLIFAYLLGRLKKLKENDFKFNAPRSITDFTVSLIDEQDNLSDFLLEYIKEETKKDDYQTSWEISLKQFFRQYSDYVIEGNYSQTNRTNFKHNVLNWAKRRDDVSISYGSNGKNYVFSFVKKTLDTTVSLEDDLLVDDNGKKLF